MVFQFPKEALVGRASKMGDYTRRAVRAWLSRHWPDDRELMFWNVDADFAERNKLKIDEECIDMVIRAMLVLVRDCPSLRVFMAHRIDEELRRESLRTGQVADIDSYSLDHVRYSDVWNEHIDMVNAGNHVHHCLDGEWALVGGCMVLAGHAPENLREVLLGQRPLSSVPMGDYCELENKNEKEKDNGTETD